MVDWDAPPKIKNFPNLMILAQKKKTWTHENAQNLRFLKKTLFLKNLKLMAFDQNSQTITDETAKYDEKNRKFSQKGL